MRPRVLIAVTVLVSALALSAMTRASAQSGDTAKGDRPASRRPVIGQVEMLPDAPDFELKSIDGKTVHLSDYRGKAVLLNFSEAIRAEGPRYSRHRDGRLRRPGQGIHEKSGGELSGVTGQPAHCRSILCKRTSGEHLH